MEEIVEIGLIDKEGIKTQHRLCIEDSEDDRVVLRIDLGDEEAAVTGSDYFGALRELRRILEQSQIRVMCYGGSKNVYPSGMSVSMGGGRKAYKLKMGEPGRIRELVDIFESGEDVQPSTVDEQEQFFKQWIDSLKKSKQA